MQVVGPQETTLRMRHNHSSVRVAVNHNRYDELLGTKKQCLRLSSHYDSASCAFIDVFSMRSNIYRMQLLGMLINICPSKAHFPAWL